MNEIFGDAIQNASQMCRARTGLRRTVINLEEVLIPFPSNPSTNAGSVSQHKRDGTLEEVSASSQILCHGILENSRVWGVYEKERQSVCEADFGVTLYFGKR